MKNIFLIIVGLFLVGCLPEAKSSNSEGTQKSEYIRVEIADRVFKIPRGYLDGRKAIGKDTESIVLEYSLPGFEVLPPHPQERAARMELIKAGRMKGMLLENASNMPPFSPVVKHTMERHDYRQEQDTHGLEKYTHIVPKPLRPEPEYAPYQQDDIFIERNTDGAVKSYLRCSPPGKDKNPGCRHRFINKGLLYQIRWSIRELPNWKQQQNAAIQFIDDFEVRGTE